MYISCAKLKNTASIFSEIFFYSVFYRFIGIQEYSSSFFTQAQPAKIFHKFNE